MKIHPPPGEYDSSSEFQRNRIIETEDAKNYKIGRDVGVYSPNKLIVSDAQFLTDGVHSPSIGSMSWNSTDQTLDIGMDYGVVQQVGLETYIRVQNNTGVTIPNGTAVGFAGVGAGEVVAVSPYLANGATPTLYILGIVTHDLPDTGEIGYCTTLGHVRGVNTSAFSVGDILYPSPSVAGALTNVKPTAPDNVIPVGAVLRVGTSDGEIFVRPTIEQQLSYGTFLKTADTSPAVVDTAYAIVLDTSAVHEGVDLGSPASRIVASQSGLYQFDVSFQLSSSNASSKNVRFWFRKNGTDIAGSTALATIVGNAVFSTVSRSSVISLGAGDYIELVWASSGTTVTLTAAAATGYAPASPSVRLTVSQVQP